MLIVVMDFCEICSVKFPGIFAIISQRNQRCSVRYLLALHLLICLLQLF